MSTQDISNPLFARIHHYCIARSEERRMRRHRERLVAGLAGRIVEVGAGDGLNFPHYPPTVSEVIAVEPEPFLRERARAAASDAPVTITVVPGIAESLPIDDASADAVVFSQVLCTVRDHRAALSEARRVLRAGGEARVLEHVAARGRIALGAQKVAGATFWPRVFGGCHPDRDTAAALEAAGFDTSQIRRLVIAPLPYIAGRALVPG